VNVSKGLRRAREKGGNGEKNTKYSNAHGNASPVRARIWGEHSGYPKQRLVHDEEMRKSGEEGTGRRQDRPLPHAVMGQLKDHKAKGKLRKKKYGGKKGVVSVRSEGRRYSKRVGR